LPLLFAVSSFVAKKRQTMHHNSASPFKTAHQYQDYQKYNINDYELKSSIFIEVDDLCSTGSYKHP